MAQNEPRKIRRLPAGAYTTKLRYSIKGRCIWARKIWIGATGAAIAVNADGVNLTGTEEAEILSILNDDGGLADLMAEHPAAVFEQWV